MYRHDHISGFRDIFDIDHNNFGYIISVNMHCEVTIKIQETTTMVPGQLTGSGWIAQREMAPGGRRCPSASVWEADRSPIVCVAMLEQQWWYHRDQRLKLNQAAARQDACKRRRRCVGRQSPHSVHLLVSEMTYTVSSGTLNSSIPYHTVHLRIEKLMNCHRTGGVAKRHATAA